MIHGFNMWEVIDCLLTGQSPKNLMLWQVSPVGEENEVGPGANAEG